MLLGQTPRLAQGLTQDRNHDPLSARIHLPVGTMRTLDANLNRASEGLRVLEDVARFILADEELSSLFKAARHELSNRSRPLHKELLSHRNVEQDVGAWHGSEPGSQDVSRPDTVALVTANAKRVQESLRVLGELARMPDLPSLDWTSYERLRFELYTAEKHLVSRLLRRDLASRIRGLYVILDRQALGDRDMADAAREVVTGGAEVIQLRDKLSLTRELLGTAQQLKRICQESGTLFLMNDRLDVALAAEANGLHVGQDDIPVTEARRALPIDRIVGVSTKTCDQALDACQQGADYIAVGSVFPSIGKPGAIVVGFEGVARAREAVTCPLVAIGGIDQTNVAQVLAAGADAVAVISAVLTHRDIAAATRRMVDEISAVSSQHRR